MFLKKCLVIVNAFQFCSCDSRFLLVTLSMLQSLSFSIYLHYVFGIGCTIPHLQTDTNDFSHFYVFIFFICSFLTAVSSVGETVNHSTSLAMASWGNRLFLSGGFNGVMLGRLISLSVPSDPCVLLPTSEACNSSTGSCVWCRDTCISSETAERYSLRIR